MRHAIIIGSGIAGLGSALRLRQKGYQVKVFEANGYVGGKISAISENGYRFDTGPSLFTMPELVDQLFELYNLESEDYFRYKRKEIICNYFWSDGSRFSAAADTEKFINEASDFFNTSPTQLKTYLKRNEEKFKLTEDVFLRKSLHKSDTYLSTKTLRALSSVWKLNLFTSLHALNESYFSHPKLVQLFDRYATYNGSSPYRTPGIMSMVPHLEMDGGTFFPEGGMHSISQSLFRLALDQGVKFYLNEKVEEILTEGRVAKGVRTSTGSYLAEVVISNADVYATYRSLMPQVRPPKRSLNQERSTSALIFYWGINRTFRELDLHNIFFSDHYEEEFDCLFDKKKIHDDPTIYVNITSKENKDDAPKGCENWFVMVNAPANYGQDWTGLISEVRGNVISKLNKTLKISLEDHIELEKTLDPVKIEQTTRSFRGSLYGSSSNNRLAAFFRHPNYASKIKNLYFCGGSVHPGGGIPLCLLSGENYD